MDCVVPFLLSSILRDVSFTEVGKVIRILVVYYESLKRELKTKTIYGFRCDERLKTKVEEPTRLACTLEEFFITAE